jgi:hypothetical protein
MKRKSLGAIAMICEEGRNLGIGLTLLTQRSARLNKDVAELADVMVAFRVVGPNSIAAVMDWFGEHVAKERHKSPCRAAPQAPDRDGAHVVSPGWLEFEGAAKIRMRRTFDSSATPKIGHVLRAPGRATKPDLDKYRDRMAATIEQAKAKDPVELKKRVAELQRQLASTQRRPTPTAAAAKEERRVEVAVLKDGQLARAEKIVDRLSDFMQKLIPAAAGIEAAIKAKVPTPVLPQVHNSIARAPTQRAPVQLRPAIIRHPKAVQSSNGDGGGFTPNGSQQRVLNAIAWFNSIGVEAPNKSAVGFVARIKPTGGHFSNTVGTALHEWIHRIHRRRRHVSHERRARARADARCTAIARILSPEDSPDPQERRFIAHSRRSYCRRRRRADYRADW